MQAVKDKPIAEYRIAKGWRIFIYLFMPPLTLLFLWMGLLLPFEMKQGAEMAFFITPLALGMAALCIYGLLDTIKGRLQRYDDRLILIDPSKRKELLLSNIDGFRQNEHYTFIYAKEGKPKRLKVSTYIGKHQELLQWLYQNYVDLDVLEEVREEEQILADADLGRNTAEREQKLKGARKFTKALNGAGVVVGLWLFIFPVFYETGIAIALLFPIPLILCVFFYKGLISINEKKGSAFPSVFTAALMPSMGLMIRALMDWSILEYSSLIPAFVGLTLIPTLLVLVGTKKATFIKKQDYFLIPGMLLIFSGYGWGAAVMINCLYDKESVPTTYEAEIISKHISGGKTTTYHLELSPWGPHTEAEDVTVDSDLYEYLEAGDSVEVDVKPGLLNAAWFMVYPKED